MFSKTVLSLVAVFCAVLLCSSGKAASAPNGQEKAAVNGTCYDSQPCGWAIYEKVSRQVNFFMRNTCECAEEKSCVKAEEDISISAYLYRCRPKESNT